MSNSKPLSARLGVYLQSQDREAIMRLARQARSFPARQDIARENAPETIIRILTEGMACRYKMMPGGRRAITGYVLPGDFCDLGVFVSGRSGACIASLTPCRVAEIPLALMTELLARPGVLRALFEMAVAEAAILREWLANMGQELSEQRVAHLICEMRKRMEAAGMAQDGELHLPLTQEELGESVGISTVHVNRVLQRLKADGLIQLHGRTVTIPDLARLETFAEFEPGYLEPHAAALPAG
jgi:CRP-like cAMP-binding protein